MDNLAQSGRDFCLMFVDIYYRFEKVAQIFVELITMSMDSILQTENFVNANLWKPNYKCKVFELTFRVAFNYFPLEIFTEGKTLVNTYDEELCNNR